MKENCLAALLTSMCLMNANSQAVYVDSKIGKDVNQGSKEAPVYSIGRAAEIIHCTDNDLCLMKINPGIYVLDEPVSISTKKPMEGKRIIVEAAILPDDPDWIPEKMPVIISTSKKGDLEGLDYHFVAALLVDASRVTIRGLKFPGYAYPNTRYFPIARFDMSLSDLRVEQCLFVGDENASHLQVGVMAHGDGVIADHCIFYNVRNSVVFWMSSGGRVKKGNGITNSIIYGSTQSGIWTASADSGFVFRNNIVANCLHFWIKNGNNPTVYSIENCFISNNRYFFAIPIDDDKMNTEGFEIREYNVQKEGVLLLRPKGKATHYDLPVDYLHAIPGSPGYELGAGLFKSRK